MRRWEANPRASRALQPLPRFCCAVLLGQHVIACYCHHYFRRDRQRHVAPLLGEHGCQSDFRPGGCTRPLEPGRGCFCARAAMLTPLAGGYSSPPGERRREHKGRTTILLRTRSASPAPGRVRSLAPRRGRAAQPAVRDCAQGTRASRAFGKLRGGRTVRITPLASAVGVSSTLRHLFLGFVVSLSFCVTLHNGGRQT